jgi:hypothetical protein
MYPPEDILKAARSIRPYLVDLLDPTTAAQLDQHLAELLAQAEHNPSTAIQIQQQLREHATTRDWAKKFLEDKQFADVHRTYDRFVGDPSSVHAATFKCPQCNHTWARQRVGIEPPPCPTHNIPLERLP